MKSTFNYKTAFRILKGGKVSMVVSAFLAGATISFASPATNALPTQGNVVNGNVNISTNANTMNINQASNKSIINWNTYNVGKDATVNYNFAQTNSSSLNRVTSNNPSEIYGNLNANGKVILVNPNGVVFGKGSSVNVGSLVATTMNVKDSDYLNDKQVFTKDNAIGSIVNEGTITAQEKGYIALLSPKVLNEGVIRAVKGSVSLSGADKIELTLDNAGLKTIIVEPSTIATLIENKSLVEADGGIIYIGVKQAAQLLDTAMNIKNSGTLQANSLDDLVGKVTLDGDNIEVSGIIQAKEGEVRVGNQNNNKTIIKSTANLEGKFVETSGKSLKVEDGVKIKAKEWLLDPTNITVASGGSETLSGTPATTSTAGDVTVSGATINAQLDLGTSVLLEADNNIIVNDNIDKTLGSTTTLTLKAGNDITIVSGRSIKSTSSTGALNLILWSNSDGNGGIVKIGDAVNGNTSTIIDTNGGGLWVGGSSGTGTGTGTWFGASDPFNLVDDGDGGTRPNPLSITVGDGYSKNVGTVIAYNSPGIYAYKADIKAGVIVFNGSNTSSTSPAIITSGYPEKITSTGNFYSYSENQGMTFSQTLDVTGDSTFYEYGNTGVAGSAIQAMYSTNDFHNGWITVYAPKDIILYGSNDLNLFRVESIGTDRTINIQSFGGNINVIDYIKSASTWTGMGYQGAITLVADVNATDGTGGNIILSNGATITIGNGGIAKLYTGSISNSTGLMNLVGSGSGRFRYSSDVIVSTDGWGTYSENKHYTTALTAGLNVIYRESPILNVTPSAYTSIYGEAISPTAITLNSGSMQNGDTFSGTGTVTSTGTTSSNAGAYNLTMSANAYDALGYKLTGTTLSGGHTITKKDITYSVAGGTTTYGTGFTLPTPTITGGTPSSTPSVKVYDAQNNDVTSQATAGTLATGTYTVKTELSDNNFSLATTGNTTGTLTIAKKDITYSIANDSKIYGQAITLPTVSFIGGTPSSTPSVKVYDVSNNDVTAQATAGMLATGTYTVKTELSDNNFALATTGNTTGTLTITKKDITYSVANDSKTYGQAITLPTVSFIGGTPSSTPSVKVYDVSNNDVTAQATAGTLVAGIYTVKTELSDNNFALATTGNTTGTLTITKKDITYSVAGGTTNYGTGFTLPTPTITGGTPIGTPSVKVYDDSNNDVTSQAIAGTLAAGTYTVKVEISDDNYQISSNGNLEGELIVKRVSTNDYQSIIENITTKSQDNPVSLSNNVKNNLIVKPSVVEQKAKVIEEVNSQGISTLTSNANPFNTNDQIKVENGGVQNNSSEEKITGKDSKNATVNVAELTISKTSNKIIAKVNPTEKSGFSFTVKEAVTVRIDAKEIKSITATSQNGAAIPSWLKFDKTTQTFSAINPPAGSLPISVKVNVIGNNKTEVISVDIIK